MFFQDVYDFEYTRATAWKDPDAPSNQVFQVWKIFEYVKATTWNDLISQLIQVWKSSLRLSNQRKHFTKIW